MNLKNYLLDKTQYNINFYVDKIEEKKSNVNNWKFATDEMFTPVPFYHELNNFKKGRLLKLETEKIDVVNETL